MARLLRDQGYTATGRAQLLAQSGVSNGSLYHHFPGGMQELAEAALEASGQAVGDALRDALDAAPSAALGVIRFLDIAKGPDGEETCPGCPIAPTALESPIISPRLRAAAAQCFDQWEGLIAARLTTDGWPEDSVAGDGLGGSRPHRGRIAPRSGERAGEPPRERKGRRALAAQCAHRENGWRVTLAPGCPRGGPPARARATLVAADGQSGFSVYENTSAGLTASRCVLRDRFYDNFRTVPRARPGRR